MRLALSLRWVTILFRRLFLLALIVAPGQQLASAALVRVYIYNATGGNIAGLRLYENGVDQGTVWGTLLSGAWGVSTAWATPGSSIAGVSSGSVVTVPTNQITGANGGYLYYFGSGTNCATFSRSYTVTNTSSVALWARLYRSGNLYEGARVASGGHYQFEVPDVTICPNGQIEDIEIRWENVTTEVEGDTEIGITFNSKTNTSSAWDGGVGGGVGAFDTNNTSGPVVFDPVLSRNLTNGPIDFTGQSTTAARDETLKAGFNALLENVQEVKKAIDLNTLQTKFSGTNSSSGGSGGTNIVSLDDSGITNALAVFRQANTNLLTEISGKLGYTNDVGASATNQTSAEASANALVGSINTSAQDAIDGLGSGPPTVLDGGDATALTFEFCGYELNLDPEVRFPGIGTFFKNALIAVIALSLGRFLVNLYRETAAVYASSQTGGVPAVGPWGSVGVGIAALVPVIIVTMWVVVFALVFSYMLSPLLDLSGKVGSLSMGNATALYLINYFLPVSFALSAAWTRIVAPLAVTKLVIVSASAQRFLFGK